MCASVYMCKNAHTYTPVAEEVMVVSLTTGGPEDVGLCAEGDPTGGPSGHS